MRISFVIPAYNESDMIGRCLEAIIREAKGQENEIEIIVVDNASTDNTAEVAKSYQGIKVVYEPQKGIVTARQRGLIESKGDLIANVDADVIITNGWVQKVFEEFARNPNLVSLSGPFIYTDLPLWIRFWTKVFYGLGFLIYILNRFILRVGSMLQGGNFVIKKSTFLKVGGYDTNIDFYGEDTDVARRLSKVGDVKWTFKLPVYASGRRLAKEGALRTGLRYALNYFWVTFFKKPFTKTSKDIRIAKK